MEQLTLSPEYTEILRGKIGERLDGENSQYVSGNRGTMSLWNLVSDYEGGHISIPPHQRDDCWPLSQKLDFLIRIANDETPPGCFEFYQLLMPNGRKSALHLNDGVQRLFAALYIWKHHKSFSISEEDVEYLFRNTDYPTTTKLHRSHEEALARFQTVNNNLQLTAYQKIIGVLVYSHGDSAYDFWQQYIDQVHSAIFENGSRVVGRLYPSETAKNYIGSLHYQRRHDLSVFFRCVSQNKELTDYKPGETVSIEKLSQKDPYYPEQKLRILFKDWSQERAQQKLQAFKKMIELETTMIEQIWCELTEPGNYISTSAYRWLLDVAIWRKNNRKPIPVWKDFVTKFLDKTSGQTNAFFSYEDGEPGRLVVNVGRPRLVEQFCYILDSSLTEGVKPQKRPDRKKKTDKKPGWHDSHYQPQATHGDGPTFREAGLLNMSRGAKPVDNSDL